MGPSRRSQQFSGFQRRLKTQLTTKLENAKNRLTSPTQPGRLGTSLTAEFDSVERAVERSERNASKLVR